MAIFLPCIFPQCEDSQSLDTKLKLMSDIKLEMEALMGEIKTKIHNNTIQQQHTTYYCYSRHQYHDIRHHYLSISL